MKKWCLACTS